MSTENRTKLGELTESLDQLYKEHAEILSVEPTIAHPLDNAVRESRRRYKTVVEATIPKESL